MSRRRRLLIPLAILAALLVLGAVALRLLIDPERLKETVLAQARAATGYDLEAGPASIRLGWSGAGIRVESFRMASPDSSQLLEVERTDLYLKLLPLVRKQVALRELVLHRPRLSLSETPPAPGPEAGFPPGQRPVGSPALAILAVESWKVEEGGFIRRAADGTLELTGLDLAGGLRWTPREGGRGTAEGRAGGGRWTGAAGAWDLPPLAGRAEFSMNAAGDSLSLPELILESGAARIILAGGYALRGETWAGALEGRAEPVDWAAVHALLPAGAEATLEGKELGGRFTLERLRVELTGAGETRVSGQLLVEEFSARMAEAPLGLAAGRARITFAPGRISLADGTGRLGDEAVSFHGLVEGDPPQRFTASVATALSGPALSGLLPPAARLQLRSGSLALDLTVAGELPAGRSRLPQVEGRVDLRDLGGVLRDLPLREGRGTILLRNGGAEVNDLGLRWGGSDLVVNGVVPKLADPRLRFTLAAETLDLDEILSPAGPANAAPAPDDTPGAGPTADDGPATLVGLPATGWVDIARLRVHGEDLREVRVHVDLGLEGLTLRDATARLHDGTLRAALTVVPGSTPESWRYAGEGTLAGVPAGPLGASWFPGGERVEGTADADFSVSGLAAPGLDPRSNLTLEGDLSLRDGAFVNIAPLRSVAEALQVSEGMGDRWPFRDLWLRFAVRAGRVTVDTLRVGQRGLAWNVTGSVGLAGDLQLAGTLRADPRVVTLPAEAQPFASFLLDPDGMIPLDFRLGGSFADPSFGLDWESLAARAAAKAREMEGAKLKKQLEESVGDPETLERLKKLIPGWGKKAGG